MLLHDSRNEDGIKSFFQEVHELYIKVMSINYYFEKKKKTVEFLYSSSICEEVDMYEYAS